MHQRALGLTCSAAAFFLAVSCGDSSSTPATTTGDTGTTAAKLDIPMGKAAILPWLQAKSYASWPKESKVHATLGDHDGQVRTYLHPSLDASLKAGAKEHPAGAAMVKEIYGVDGTTLNGWAVAQKTEASSASGANWYFFELRMMAGTPNADGKNASRCVTCHSGGTDFVLSNHPLQ